MQTYMSHYYEKIMSVERSVGNIIKMLEEKGVADNTVIIYLSDHGTHWGEKQLSGKWTPYDLSLRIPFIVYDPRPKAIKTKVSDEMVLNIDIAPTLLDMAGIPVPETMDGKSLVPLIYNKKAKWRDHFFYEHFTSLAPIRYIPRNVGVRTQTAKYVRWIDMNPPVEEYFDLTVDSDERTNLISNPEYKNQIVAARNLFDNWRTDNPSTYTYDVYGSRPQFGAKDIDWEKFKEVRPKEYEKIKAAVDSMEVTWEQALDDWEIRSEICLKTKYWY
jgi:arylsulfatase A-like enzyme